MNVGAAIKEYRIKNGLTQTEFGKIVGVNKQAVSKWENGAVCPKMNILFEISKVIGIPIECFDNNYQSADENNMLIYKHKTIHNIGLNSLYNSVYDYDSFYMFIDSLIDLVNFINPFSSMGYMLINETIESEDSHENAISIESISLDGNIILIEVPDLTIYFSKEKVAGVERVTSFNNEAYSFNVYINDEKNTYFQLIFDIMNDES